MRIGLEAALLAASLQYPLVGATNGPSVLETLPRRVHPADSTANVRWTEGYVSSCIDFSQNVETLRPAGFEGLRSPVVRNMHMTGKTRAYSFTIARSVFAPDGFEKHGLLVNNQFPGPTIEADWGDWIEVTVRNNITSPEEGTSVHWHGLRQYDTQVFDGVPSVTQCPIAPGSTFKYRFLADSYGTSWWHSHYSAQYTAGIFGPLIIHGPKHVDYDVDIGALMLGDWYHRNYSQILEDVAGTSESFAVYVPTSDNSLINGKNNFNCSTEARNTTCTHQVATSEFKFYAGKRHRIRLVNSGAAALVHFSIDGHDMQVISNDFTPIKPYHADYITLGVGQRTDVIVRAPRRPEKAYWIRSTISLNCSVSYTTTGLAVALYDHINPNVNPTTSASSAAKAADRKSLLCQNDQLNRTIPLQPKAIDRLPSTTETIEIDLLTNATGHHVWTMNNHTERTDYNTPILGLASQRNFSFDSDWNVYNFGSNRTVRIVMNNKYQSAHPMHLHGHSFAVVAEGDGYWDGHTLSNPENPLRRDTHMLRRYGHLVIQFELDNPGVWLYHCHIAWHSAMGYTLSVLELPQKIKKDNISNDMTSTCKDWNRWTSQHTVDQIDSGT